MAGRSGTRPLALSAIGLCAALASCLSQDIQPAAVASDEPLHRFVEVDGYLACGRARAPDAFVAIPPGRRWLGFALHGDGPQTVSVVGADIDDAMVEMASWQTGHAYAIRYAAAKPQPWAEALQKSVNADPRCDAGFRRRVDLQKAIQRADPATLRSGTMKNALGTVAITEFATRGRALACPQFEQDLRTGADRNLAVTGMDCRSYGPDTADSLRRDLVPILKSIRFHDTSR